LNLCLDYNIPHFKIGTVVDTDITAKRLSEIYRPEGLREDEKAGESHSIGEVAEEESRTVSKICIGGFIIDVEKSREVRSGGEIVEQVFADE
jgi:hypothetical protein